MTGHRSARPLPWRGATRLGLAALVAMSAGMTVASGSAIAATTFVVNRIGDLPDLNLANSVCDVSTASGRQCTLRAAIQEANDTAGSDTINFNITSTSKVIAPGTPLPPITDEVTINGYSQSGAAANTAATGSNAVLKIVLDGVNAGVGANGLEVAAYKAFITGLVIQRFDGSGVLFAVEADKSALRGSFIGTTAAGTAARANGVGVTIMGNQIGIGGAAAADRNVISGNEAHGILITGAGAFGTSVVGNVIGLRRGGAVALPNGGDGVQVHAAADFNSIGGTCATCRNVISGNAGDGIVVVDSSDVNIVGNYIGTNAAGNADVGNAQNGIVLRGGAGHTIGGATSGAGNVISGNNREGIALADVTDSVVQGNLIGTDAAGMAALGNSSDGIQMENADGNQIGGTTVGARNVISANSGAMNINGSDNNVIQGNRIGTRVDGTGDLGNNFTGIDLTDSADNLIGGAGAAGNVIAHTNSHGVSMGALLSTGNIVQGNAIIGNSGDGVSVRRSNNQVLGNSIIGNAGDGIAIDSAAGPVIGVRISGNITIGNGGLGIDLVAVTDPASGVTANDSGDGDSGSNMRQNFPVLTSAVRQQNGLTVVSGSLNSSASTEFKVELFLVVADPSNHGESQLMLATQNITTNASGNKTFSFALGSLVAGQQVTATAINNITNNSSEFALNVPVTQAP